METYGYEVEASRSRIFREHGPRTPDRKSEIVPTVFSTEISEQVKCPRDGQLYDESSLWNMNSSYIICLACSCNSLPFSVHWMQKNDQFSFFLTI
jgi:hypothetical protein